MDGTGTVFIYKEKMPSPLSPIPLDGRSGRSLPYLPMGCILRGDVLSRPRCEGIQAAVAQAGVHVESEDQMRRPTEQLQQRVKFNGHSKGYRTLFRAQS